MPGRRNGMKVEQGYPEVKGKERVTKSGGGPSAALSATAMTSQWQPRLPSQFRTSKTLVSFDLQGQNWEKIKVPAEKSRRPRIPECTTSFPHALLEEVMLRGHCRYFVLTANAKVPELRCLGLPARDNWRQEEKRETAKFDLDVFPSEWYSDGLHCEGLRFTHARSFNCFKILKLRQHPIERLENSILLNQDDCNGGPMEASYGGLDNKPAYHTALDLWAEAAAEAGAARWSWRIVGSRSPPLWTPNPEMLGEGENRRYLEGGRA
ncbi:hypothetical protein B0H16DRAFT_1472390 [Mycena metata]|uniref:Uncharacterized protein n=1 Tax=Mycena metata TaxID=1033252 RepID=A0AAD7MNU7_9AGAR|nr:hypothetical protein B0H16DRAFT_1472390 [Mycena metata]